MKKRRLRIYELKKVFGQKPFTNKELYSFYLEKEPKLIETTYRGRVYALKRNNIIHAKSRGLYVANHEKKFDPTMDMKLLKIYKKINKLFPYATICAWETSWIHKYMIHQSLTDNIIIEIDKEVISSAFATLKESYKNVLINPNKYEFKTYAATGQQNILIKNLLSSSPLEIKQNIVIPRIEKIIVDLFADDELFFAYQGNELKNIYEGLFNDFSIHLSTLYQYANKRHVKEKFISYIREKTSLMQNNIDL